MIEKEISKKDNCLVKPIVYTKNNVSKLKEIPKLDNGQIYIYVMLNYPKGDIKIGKTIDIQQRLISLSGSNGGGNKIIKVYCSPATWIHSMETTCHNHYHFARIPGTEWFDGNKLNYDEVVEFVNGLFFTKGYNTCNELRRKMNEEKDK